MHVKVVRAVYQCFLIKFLGKGSWHFITLVRAVAIYSHFSLTLLHLFLEDPMASLTCQTLPKHLDCKILLHSGV